MERVVCDNMSNFSKTPKKIKNFLFLYYFLYFILCNMNQLHYLIIMSNYNFSNKINNTFNIFLYKWVKFVQHMLTSL